MSKVKEGRRGRGVGRRKRRTSQGPVDSEDEGFEGKERALDFGEEEVGLEGD